MRLLFAIMVMLMAPAGLAQHGGGGNTDNQTVLDTFVTDDYTGPGNCAFAIAAVSTPPEPTCLWTPSDAPP